jgi:type IV pilus assembly protein PilA
MEKTMKRLQQGFTLIELMIVVAIVGILAAIALPAYQDYVIRSKMSEGVAAAAACKTSISEYVSTKNNFPASTDVSGCSTLMTQYVASLSVDGGGGTTPSIINVNVQNTGAKPAECTLTLTAVSTALPDITAWIGTHSGCQAKYVPSNFR